MIKLHHVLLLAAAPFVASCSDAENWGPDALLEGKTVARDDLLARGRAGYSTYCVGCHGVEGDGMGPAARFLNPKPRDFRVGKVKFAGVPAGEMPRDEDLIRTINHGLRGTSMPAWNLLPVEDVLAIVAYLKTFTPDRKPPGGAVTLPADPWVRKPERGVAEGEAVYHGIASCMNCHPAYVTKDKIVEHMKTYDIPVTGFRPGLYEGETKDSDWGAPIRPPDFWIAPIKTGTEKESLVRVIAAGVGGTAMPSWGSSLTPKQLWGLAYYVESIAVMRGSPEAKAQKQALLEQPEFIPPEPKKPDPVEPPPEATEDAPGDAEVAPK